MALSPKARETLEHATTQYEAALPRALDYLTARGIDEDTARHFRLGYVAAPIIGHENYTGRLAIPYLTPSGVVDIRFRCTQPHSCKDAGHAKYLTQPGHRTRIYHTPALLQADDTVAITEGELDAIILNKIGIPAVGIAGAQAWQSDYYPRIFADYRSVLVFGDGDEAGQSFARNIAKDLDDATLITMPAGTDVTDLYLASGPDAILARAGLTPPTGDDLDDLLKDIADVL